MAVKQSPREKILRQIAGAVKECRDFNSGMARPEDREHIHAFARPQLVFLTLEVKRERHRNGQPHNIRKFY